MPSKSPAQRLCDIVDNIDAIEMFGLAHRLPRPSRVAKRGGGGTRPSAAGARTLRRPERPVCLGVARCRPSVACHCVAPPVLPPPTRSVRREGWCLWRRRWRRWSAASTRGHLPSDLPDKFALQPGYFGFFLANKRIQRDTLRPHWSGNTPDSFGRRPPGCLKRSTLRRPRGRGRGRGRRRSGRGCSGRHPQRW